MQKTLPTADHQAVQAFQLDALRQHPGLVSREQAAIQLQIIDTSTLLTQTLSQQLAPTLATQDQYPGIGPCDSLAQGGQFKQGFAVVAGLRIVNVEPVIGQYLRSGSPDAEPGQLRPRLIQLLHSKACSRFADHNHRAITAQVTQHRLLLRRYRQGFDVEQRQAAAENAGVGQRCRQGSRLFGRPRQQQTPASHCGPASP